MSPLLLASLKGKCGLVTELLAAGADVNKQDSRGWSVSPQTISLIEQSLVYLLATHLVCIKEFIKLSYHSV